MNKHVKEIETTTGETLNIHGARLSRRSFLGASGSLLVSLALKPNLSFASSATNSLDASDANSWVAIHADNTVVIRTGKCDFGQSSIYTAYRQIVAEELGIPVEAITTVISGDTDRTPDGGGTFGLLRTNVLNLRKVAAYTREAVIKLAAQRFGVTADQVSIKDGRFSAGDKHATYGDLIAKQALTLEIPVEGKLTGFRGLTVAGDPPLKNPADYTVIGQPVKNPIVRPKVSGELTWVGDVKLPDMLHARVIHPATLGSTLVKAGNLDKSQFPNTQIVTINNLLAVVSPDEWEAVQAASAVSATTQWSEWEGLPGSEELQDFLRNQVDWDEVPKTPGRFNSGSQAVDTAHTHEASYFVPFHKHAPIGPTVSLAEVNNGTVTVHTHSQNPQFLRMAIAKMMGESEESVIVRTYAGPGHFGRSNGGNAGSEDEAVLLAHKLKKPVRVQWMRHDDMQWSTQSSAMLSDIRIGLDDKGRIVQYEGNHYGPPMQDDRPIGALLADLPTISSPIPQNPMMIQRAEIPVADSWVYGGINNVAETGHGAYQLGERESPLKVGLRDHSMRTPIQFQQNFPRELAITEAAALAGIDALEFRLQHATDPRFQALLTRLKEESQWQTRPSPAKADESAAILQGRGVSIMFRDNGYWACAANIAVTPSNGLIKVEKITLVADPGIVVNPLQLKRQAEAGCLMGVSQALHEEVAFDKSRITSSDWFSYPILTMAEVPDLNVVIAPYQDAKIYGQGSESANALVPSAIAGALFDATGKPARRLPLRPDYIKTLL